ncbi:MAG: hypothetical protein K2Y12_01695 [Chitinophagaceae bacterium]|nr:hypothetical protein [Chitinophagaceae bacterium]
MKSNTKKAVIAFSWLIILFSCKKENISYHMGAVVNLPTLRVDKYFPNGILVFDSKESFRSYWDSVQHNSNYVKEASPNFKSFNDKYNKYYNNKRIPLVSSSTDNISSNSTIDVDVYEFLLDINAYALPAEPLGQIVNENLQVIVEDNLYQFTRIGVLEVSMSQVDSYVNLYQANYDNINFNQSFSAFPTEVMVAPDVYQIEPGIRRLENISDEGNLDIFRQSVRYIDDNGGTNGNPSPANNDYFVNYQDPNYIGIFGEGVAVQFNDWDKRRIVFKVQNIRLPFLGIIGQYAKLDIKAKVQREKKFLFVKYWGPSYAEEIIVGCDNMEISTNYVFPYPQQSSNLSRPAFSGLSQLRIGNHIIDALNIRVNANVLGFTLNNSQLSSLIDGQLNQIVGGVYQNIFRTIETRLINEIDPSYLQRYANYTTMLERLNQDNTFKIVLGKTEKAQGYSHVNEWIIDQNIGFSWNVNGGVGGYPLNYWYDYFPKGSFYGRVRTGNTWRGIRILITKS